jgi:hypothetical protein
MFESAEPVGWEDEPDPAAPAEVPGIGSDNVVLLFAAAGTRRQRLEWLLDEPPSTRTLQALELMADEAMAPDERMLYAALWARQAAAATAMSMRAMVSATTPAGSGWSASKELLESELALVLRRTDRSLAQELHLAERLACALPCTERLLAVGDITTTHARAMHEATRHLTVEQARTVDASVAHRGAEMTASAFRRLVRQAVADVDTNPVERHAEAKRQAGVSWWPEQDGMGTLGLRMTATDGVAAMREINRRALARNDEDDPRTHGQRQIAAVLEPLIGTTTTAPPPRAATGTGRRAEIVATIDLLSLLGLRDHPGELDGHGPIPAETVRDVTCRYPGCTRNAIYCDDEHCRPYEDAGPTSSANCALMCRRHHNRKTHDGYQYQRPDPRTGETRWTTPAGFTYRQQPAGYSPTGRDTGSTLRVVHDPPF